MSGYPGQNYQGGYQQGYQAPPPQAGWQQPPQYGQPPPNNQYQQPAQYGPPPGQPTYGQPPPQGQGWGSPPPPDTRGAPSYGAPPQGHYGAPPPGQYGAPPPGQYGAPPPGQYGAPPPGQYGAPPPGQYGAPPPGQYGAPPPGQYGAPPPGQYGAPPPNQYGAPPPAQYGAPPPNQYGAPPPQPQGYPGPAPHVHAGPRTQPSLGYGPVQTANVDLTREAHALRGAMKGFGTNEKTLISTLVKLDPLQANALRTQYSQRLMRDLVADLKSESSGYFRDALVQIASGPLVADCIVLHEAMDRLGTKEAALDDVLVGRSNADMEAIKAAYRELYGHSLEQDLRSDLSAGTEQMYMMIVAARRNEDSAPVDRAQTDADVTKLDAAMGNLLTKNAMQVCELLFTRSDAQIRALAQRFLERFHKSLDAALASKFTGHMQSALRLLVARAIDRPLAEAQRLEEAMKGVGTEDKLLVARVVRCHWDQNFMRQVAAAYKGRVKPGTELYKRIKGETSGSYKDLMLACVPERV